MAVVSGFSRVLAEEQSGICLASLAPSQCKYKVGQDSSRGVKLTPIHLKEDKRRSRSGALVAVNEGMLLDEVKKVSGGHLKNVTVQEVSAEGGRRHRQR